MLELGNRWLAFDGRLVETRAGLAAAAARRWDEAERQFGIAREVAEQMSNRLELADLSRLQARMLLERGGIGDDARAAEMLEEALTAYRAFGMPVYADEAERLRRQARGRGLPIHDQPRRSAASNGVHRARSSAPARSGSATKIVLTPRSASSK